jgi:copper/silver efflux system protein
MNLSRRQASENVDLMKRIAAPMIGGMVSSTLLTLIVISVLYGFWWGRSLPIETHVEAVAENISSR